MNAHVKDFGDLPKAPSEDEFLKFRLAGEEFSCYPQIPGATLLRFVGASKDNVRSADQIVHFLTTALVKGDSRDRFNALTEDPERLVSIETLGSIVEWLVEEYGDRPETQPGR